MCQKKPFCNRHIDSCIKKLIDRINEEYQGVFETLASCCGHEVYPTSIVVLDTVNNFAFEWFTKKRFSSNTRGHIRANFYSKDKKGYYYLPDRIFIKKKRGRKNDFT